MKLDLLQGQHTLIPVLHFNAFSPLALPLRCPVISSKLASGQLISLSVKGKS